MKRLILVFVLMFVAIGSWQYLSQPDYLPDEFCNANPYKCDLYVSTLEEMDEPSLKNGGVNSASTAFRLLWLRSFHVPVAIRIEISEELKSGMVHISILDATGNFDGRMKYHPGALIMQYSYELEEFAIADLVRLQAKTQQWFDTLDPVVSRAGFDGSQWVFEIVKDGKYHFVDRYSPLSTPTDNPALRMDQDLSAFGKALIEFSTMGFGSVY